MKYYGKIEDNNDLVNKKYVDDNSGGLVNDGKLKVNDNSNIDSSIVLFTANQDRDKILNFIGNSGITVTKTNSLSSNDQVDITISGSGSGSSSSNSYHIENVITANTSSLSLPTIYKNLVVKFMYNSISTPGSGTGMSYVLNFAGSGLSAGDEMYIYLRNAGDTAGVNITVPHSLTFTNSGSDFGSSTSSVYPVVYNGFYTNSSNYLYDNEVINLQYNNNTYAGGYTAYTSLVLHVFFDGEVYYINKLEYTIPKGPVS